MTFSHWMKPKLRAVLDANSVLGNAEENIKDLIVQYSTCQAEIVQEDECGYCDKEDCGCENGFGGLRHHDPSYPLSCYCCGNMYSNLDCSCVGGAFEDEPCPHEEECYPKHEGECECGRWRDFSCLIHGPDWAAQEDMSYDEWKEYVDTHEFRVHEFDGYDTDGEELHVEYGLIHKKGDYSTSQSYGKIKCVCKHCVIARKRKKEEKRRKYMAKKTAERKKLQGERRKAMEEEAKLRETNLQKCHAIVKEAKEGGNTLLCDVALTAISTALAASMAEKESKVADALVDACTAETFIGVWRERATIFKQWRQAMKAAKDSMQLALEMHTVWLKEKADKKEMLQFLCKYMYPRVPNPEIDIATLKTVGTKLRKLSFRRYDARGRLHDGKQCLARLRIEGLEVSHADWKKDALDQVKRAVQVLVMTKVEVEKLELSIAVPGVMQTVSPFESIQQDEDTFMDTEMDTDEEPKAPSLPPKPSKAERSMSPLMPPVGYEDSKSESSDPGPSSQTIKDIRSGKVRIPLRIVDTPSASSMSSEKSKKRKRKSRAPKGNKSPRLA